MSPRHPVIHAAIAASHASRKQAHPIKLHCDYFREYHVHIVHTDKTHVVHQLHSVLPQRYKQPQHAAQQFAARADEVTQRFADVSTEGSVQQCRQTASSLPDDDAEWGAW
jgi:hypothetical protein